MERKVERQNTKSQVVFLPSGKRGYFEHGIKILDAARELGVDLDSVCGARGICGRCQIEIAEGKFAKFALESQVENASKFSDTEQKYHQKRGLAKNRRLGCSTIIQGDLVVDVPPESQIHRQIIRKELSLKTVKLNPAVRLYMIEVEEPDMHKPSSDLERVIEAIAKQWDIKIHHIDLHIIQTLQSILKEGKWQITVAIYRCQSQSDNFISNHLIAIWPGFNEIAYGLAVDIGSTTIAAHICDLTSGKSLASDGIMNPQIRFGEDLMSRVSYIMMNPGATEQLTKSVRDAIEQLAQNIVKKLDRQKKDILEIVIVGNPIMHHIFFGINPVDLGVAPFALASALPSSYRSSELGLDFHAGTRIFSLPCIAGHVGADAAAAILCEAPYQSDEIRLIVDIGTNAEIIIGNRHKMLAASSPTGPAFEGAQISCGQRAAPGAIERVRINKDTLEPSFKIIGCESWSDQKEFQQELQNIKVTGICGSAIIEIIAEMYLAGIISPDGRIRSDAQARTARIVKDGRTFSYIVYEGSPTIRITQNDIRAIQLAKAALYAGARLLMDKMPVDSLDSITLAGAFGSHIDTKYAMLLGLIPDCAIDKVRAAGNAAGSGAVIALLDYDAREEIKNVIKSIQKIETAVEPDFQKYFIDAISIPNKKDEFEHLKQIFELPQKNQDKGSIENPARRKSRRRQ